METSSAEPRVVCDAGPLIHLHELTATDLLGDFSEVIVPESVWLHGTIGVILRSLRKARRTADQVNELLQAIPVRSSLHIRRHLLDEAIRQVKARGFR